MNFGYKEKVAVITGSSRGIGRQTAEEMLKLGAKVMLVARGKEDLNQAIQELSSYGEVSGVIKDVQDKDSGEVIVKETVKRFGQLDIVVNNAGGSFAESFEDVDLPDWQNDIDLKLSAAVKLSKAALPYLKESQHGCILNLTAISGKAPAANTSPTSVSRAAGLALTKTMSKDLGQYGIRVNAVCIGLVKSDQIEKRWQREAPDMSWEEYAVTGRDNIPLGRIGETKEAANVITFLCSDAASYVSGTTVNIDGGASAVL